MTRGLGLLVEMVAGLVAVGCDCTYERSHEVPGNVRAFDPVAAAPAVQRYAGPGAELVKMAILHCPSNGLLDFEASYYPGWTVPARYLFVRPKQQQTDPSLPVGARPATEPTEGVEVEVMNPHWVQSTTNGQTSSLHHLGMNAQFRGAPSEPRVPLPACTLAQLWTAARSQGAPGDAVATITYDAEGYRFVIPSTSIDLRFDMSCALVPRAP